MPKKTKTNNLQQLVELVTDDRKHIAETLAKELEFMTETLERLRADINSRGVVELFKNGKQEFLKESPALKSYNTTIQRYSLLYKQLTDLLPKQAASSAGGKLHEFLKLNSV